MATLNLVLVEPQIPQNTGNIARTCAVTGARLHLVGPMGFTITDRQLKRAGLDYWDKLELVRTETLTCYNGIKGNGCGHCAACNLRANGLNHYLADKPRVMAAMKQKTGLK